MSTQPSPLLKTLRALIASLPPRRRTQLLLFASTAVAAGVLYRRPGAEDGLDAQCPGLAIKWPLGVAVLPERDGSNPMLANEFVGFLEAQIYAKHH